MQNHLIRFLNKKGSSFFRIPCLPSGTFRRGIWILAYLCFLEVAKILWIHNLIGLCVCVCVYIVIATNRNKNFMFTQNTR